MKDYFAHPNHSFFFPPVQTLSFTSCFCAVFVFLSPSSLPVSAHTEIPQLTDLSLEDVSDTTISLRWSPINTTAITGYRITVVAAGESIPIFEELVLPTTDHYTVYGLEPGIDYDFSVITVTENGESQPTTLTQQTCKSHVFSKQTQIVILGQPFIIHKNNKASFRQWDLPVHKYNIIRSFLTLWHGASNKKAFKLLV